MWTGIIIVFVACFFSLGHAECPNGRLATNATLEENLSIVKIHNKFRKMLEKGEVAGQPRAAKMKKLAWNQHLAQEAQKVADTCEFVHVLLADNEGFPIGQNLFLQTSDEPIETNDWKSCIQHWFDEEKMYHYPYMSRKTLHYTQLVWANTKFIGCAVSHYFKEGKYHKLYVCNYTPGGNIEGVPPYKKA